MHLIFHPGDMNTAARLKEHGASHRVELCQEDSQPRAYVRSPVAAIMFNLHPRASRETATKAEHSREAVETAVNLCGREVVTVVCYPGHWGAEETHEILVTEA